MNRTYEQVFLAIAVRNGMMRHEQAQICLSEYAAHPNGSIEEVVRSHGMLTDRQISLLQSGVKKVFETEGGEENRPGSPPAGGERSHSGI